MKKRYDKTMPALMYNYFRCYDDDGGAPSFVKFAVRSGLTVADLLSFRKNRKFDLSYLACCEIRRDYLIDKALLRKFDPSFVKFLLSEGKEGVGDDADSEKTALSVTIEVVS